MSSAQEKLACCERELVYRRRVYPRLVQQGKLPLERAQKQIALMEEIAADYRALAAGPTILADDELPLTTFVETRRTVKG